MSLANGLRSFELHVALTATVVAGWAAVASAQTGNVYGRTTASGLWGDAAWVDNEGNTGGIPAANDFVTIGAFELPWASALSPAAVTLSEPAAVADLVIGNISGTSGGGSLALTGSASLSAATLSLDSGANGFATLFLNDRMVTLTGIFAVSGTGATVSRTTGGIDAQGLDVSEGAVYAANGSDAFAGSVAVATGGAFVANVALPSITSLAVNGSATTFTANAAVGAPAATMTVDAGAAFTVNAAVSAYSLQAGNATISLAGGMLSTVDLDLGSTLTGITTVQRSGGLINTTNLTLANGSTLALQLGDSIADNVTLSSGASLTLGQNLPLAASLSVDAATLNLDGFIAAVGGAITLRDGAAVNRGNGGGIDTTAFTISGSTSFTVTANDAFSGQGSVINGGSLIVNAAIRDLASLTVTGSGSTVHFNAPVSGANGVIDLNDAAALMIDADVAVTALRIGAGELTISSGTLSTAVLDVGTFFAGSSSVTRSGGTVLTDSFLLANGNSFTALAGDVFGEVSLSGGSVLSVVQATGATTGLRLANSLPSALSLTESSVLQLTFDVGSGDDSPDWAFQWAGNHVETLETLLAQGRIVVTGSQASLAGVTYVPQLGATLIAVPEPATLALLGSAIVAGLARVGGSSYRRIRRHRVVSPLPRGWPLQGCDFHIFGKVP